MKFTTPIITLSDPIPPKTPIYYAKQKLIYHMIIPVIILATSVPLLITSNLWLKDRSGFIIVILFCLSAAVIIYRCLIRCFDKQPKLIISSSGIWLNNFSFCNWSEIIEAAVVEKVERGSSYYLTYKWSSGKKKILINDLNIKPNDLAELLSIYKTKYTDKTVLS